MIEVNERLVIQTATLLNEPDQRMLARMLVTLGEARFIGIVQQTLDLEDQGGMMTKNGRRRRTAGGVLCQLVKASASADERRLIFCRAARCEVQDEHHA